MDKLTKENFRIWAENLREEREFDFMDNHGCAIACFMREAGGFPNLLSVGGFEYSPTMAEFIAFPPWLVEISEALGDEYYSKPVTQKTLLKILDKTE